VLGGGQVVGEIVGARGRLEPGDHPCRDVVDMDSAEDLTWQVDAVRLSRACTVDRAAAAAVDAGKAKDAGPAGKPCLVGSRPGRAPALTGRGAFIDPGAAGVAVDSGRGEVTQPAMVQRIAVARPDRVAIGAGRDRGQGVACRTERSANRVVVIKSQVAVVAGRGDLPTGGDGRRADALRRIAEAEYEQMRHAGVVGVRRWT